MGTENFQFYRLSCPISFKNKDNLKIISSLQQRHSDELSIIPPVIPSQHPTASYFAL